MTQVSEETHIGVDIHSVAEPDPVLFGQSRIRCKDVKAKEYLEPVKVDRLRNTGSCTVLTDRSKPGGQ